MPVRVYTVTVSDSRTHENDTSGDFLRKALADAGFKIMRHVIIKDEIPHIQDLVRSVSNENLADAVVLTGGTGIAPRDVTPEALEAIYDKRLDGFGEVFRRRSEAEVGPRSMLSRASAGVVSGCVVFSLPGSTKAVKLGVELLAPILEHACDLALGRRLRAQGFAVDLIPVDDQGRLDLAAAQAMLIGDDA